MPRPGISEELVTLTQAIADSDDLRKWFLSLGPFPSAIRTLAFADMARQMRDAGEDPAITSAIASLAREDVYDSVRNALSELTGT